MPAQPAAFRADSIPVMTASLPLRWSMIASPLNLWIKDLAKRMPRPATLMMGCKPDNLGNGIANAPTTDAAPVDKQRLLPLRFCGRLLLRETQTLVPTHRGCHVS